MGFLPAAEKAANNAHRHKGLKYSISHLPGALVCAVSVESQNEEMTGAGGDLRKSLSHLPLKQISSGVRPSSSGLTRLGVENL